MDQTEKLDETKPHQEEKSTMLDDPSRARNLNGTADETSRVGMSDESKIEDEKFHERENILEPISEERSEKQEQEDTKVAAIESETNSVKPELLGEAADEEIPANSQVPEALHSEQKTSERDIIPDQLAPKYSNSASEKPDTGTSRVEVPVNPPSQNPAPEPHDAAELAIETPKRKAVISGADAA